LTGAGSGGYVGAVFSGVFRHGRSAVECGGVALMDLSLSVVKVSSPQT
jgi:hypothetical protein